MITKLFPCLILLFLVNGSFVLNAQSDAAFTLGLSVLDEHVGLPFQYIPGDSENSFNPGVALSFERSRDRTGLFQYSNALEVGYYHHAGNEQVGYVAFKPRFGLRFFQLINLNLVPGVGYARSWPTVQSFEELNGQYELSTNYGKSHFMPSLGVGVSFNLRVLTGLPISLRLRHESFLLLPALHTFSHAGISYTF